MERAWVPFVVVGLLGLACVPGLDAQGTYDDILQVGYDADMFQEVDINDALAATEVWVDVMKERFADSRVLETRTKVFSTVDEIVDAVHGNTVDIVVMPALRYLEVRKLAPIVGFYTAELRGEIAYEFALMVATSSAYRTLEDLAGKDVYVATASRGGVPQVWLGVELMKRGLAEGSSHFGRFVPVNKVAQAALPVFFGKADACIVPVESFETMAELNPQVNRDLRTILLSPKLSRAPVCIRKNLESRHRRMINDGLRELHTFTEGQQVLSLFRTDRLVPFDPLHIKPLEDLVIEHRLLKGRQAKAF